MADVFVCGEGGSSDILQIVEQSDIIIKSFFFQKKKKPREPDNCTHRATTRLT